MKNINNLNQYTSISNFVSFAPSCEINPHYDADGNMVRLVNHILAYDAENRLSAYTFGVGYATGTLRSAYVYDHLGRRISKMDQESKVKNPGGIVPLTYWHTNTVTTFVYDGWNLIYERVAHTNGTVDEIEYVWGLDLSGSLQGAGGVGGLLYEKRNGNIFIPCYDANGNITAYIDTNGVVRAYRQYDAFGNTIAKGGAMVDVLHFWFSTKYLDHDTGLYYYGYRYYSSLLQRWINCDPIEERGGMNEYGFVRNNPVCYIDYLGLTKIKVDMNIQKRQNESRIGALHDFLIVTVTVLEPPKKGNVLNFIQIKKSASSNWSVDAEHIGLQGRNTVYPYYYTNQKITEYTSQNKENQSVIEFGDRPGGSLDGKIQFYLFVVEYNRTCRKSSATFRTLECVDDIFVLATRYWTFEFGKTPEYSFNNVDPKEIKGSKSTLQTLLDNGKWAVPFLCPLTKINLRN